MSASMKQGQCPECGSAEIFPVEVNKRLSGEIWVRLRDDESQKGVALTTLVCSDCGLIRQYVADDAKSRKLLARALIRPSDG
ncbi:hypothetical protein ACQB60_19590 [Actinomycetota bacterium Odt1-20B]